MKTDGGGGGRWPPLRNRQKQCICRFAQQVINYRDRATGIMVGKKWRKGAVKIETGVGSTWKWKIEMGNGGSTIFCHWELEVGGGRGRARWEVKWKRKGKWLWDGRKGRKEWKEKAKWEAAVNLKVKLELNWGVNIAADKKNRFTLHFENFLSLAHLKKFSLASVDVYGAKTYS